MSDSSYSKLCDYLLDRKNIEKSVQEKMQQDVARHRWNIVEGLKALIESGEMKPETPAEEIIKRLSC